MTVNNMIDSCYKSVSQLRETYQLDQFAAKLQKVAWKILKTVAACALFLTNSPLFSLGFIVGIIYPEESARACERVMNAFRANPIEMSLIAVSIGILALPVSLAAASFLYSISLGSSFSAPLQENEGEHLPQPA